MAGSVTPSGGSCCSCSEADGCTWLGGVGSPAPDHKELANGPAALHDVLFTACVLKVTQSETISVCYT